MSDIRYKKLYTRVEILQLRFIEVVDEILGELVIIAKQLKMIRRMKVPNLYMVDVRGLATTMDAQRENIAKSNFEDTEENIYEVFKLLENVEETKASLVNLRRIYQCALDA